MECNARRLQLFVINFISFVACTRIFQYFTDLMYAYVCVCVMYFMYGESEAVRSCVQLVLHMVCIAVCGRR